MKRAVKAAIVKTLVYQGRRDLARIVANYAYAADANELVGNTFWGKDAKLHFFGNTAVLEEIPGGKRVGVTTSKLSLYFPRDLRRADGEVIDMLVKLANSVKTNPWKRLAGMLINIHNVDKKAGGTSQLEMQKQKGVHAPDSKQAELPKPANNKHKVWIDMTGDSVSIRDNNDQNNLPSAFTQGPRAYKMALKIRDQWMDKPFREILKIWSQNRIKYHHYMGMD